MYKLIQFNSFVILVHIETLLVIPQFDIHYFVHEKVAAATSPVEGGVCWSVKLRFNFCGLSHNDERYLRP